MVANVSIYDELSGFIASMNPEKVIAFKPSKANQDRLDALLDKQKETALSLEEKTELEHYLIINRIVGLAKARAIKMLRV
jgi:GTP-dependent phosphoenolpyruvate carboxykinase